MLFLVNEKMKPKVFVIYKLHYHHGRLSFKFTTSGQAEGPEEGKCPHGVSRIRHGFLYFPPE